MEELPQREHYLIIYISKLLENVKLQSICCLFSSTDRLWIATISALDDDSKLVFCRAFQRKMDWWNSLSLNGKDENLGAKISIICSKLESLQLFESLKKETEFPVAWGALMVSTTNVKHSFSTLYKLFTKLSSTLYCI